MDGGDISIPRSWRVRWSAANKFHELCDSLGAEVTNGPLCLEYAKLLQDSEPEASAVVVP